MQISEKEHEYRKPDDIHPISRVTRQPVRHQPITGGDEKWYQ